jgi:hypothetical protein
MPAKSAAQYAAMVLAAKGKGNLGIPARVGREFVEETSAGDRRRFARVLARRRKRLRLRRRAK